jgi:hypothetical protein
MFSFGFAHFSLRYKISFRNRFQFYLMPHYCFMQENGERTSVIVEEETNTISTTENDRTSSYVFDRIYDESSQQEELFLDAVAPIVEQVR